ncbi:hypothetical protein [Alteriqipengyuania sp. 357]
MPAHHTGSFISDPKVRLIARRVMLFFAMLASGGNLLFPKAIVYAGFLLPALLLRHPSEILSRTHRLIWLFLIAFGLVALIGYGSGAAGGVAGRISGILGGWLLLCVYLHERRDALASDILIMLKLFAYQALATFILALVEPDLFQAFKVFGTTAEYRSIALLFTYHETSSLVSIFKRPDGFFYEPGVFQFYLNLLLYLSLFYKRRMFDAGVAVLALFTLQSTTGLLIASLICLAFAKKRWATSAPSERFLLLSVVPLLMGPMLVFTAVNTQDKLYGDMRGSAIARQYDATAGVGVVTEHPLFGVGIDSERLSREMLRFGDARTSVRTSLGNERVTSNGVLEIAGMMGIPFTLFIFFGLLRQHFFQHRLLFAMMAVFTFISETLVLTPFFMAIILSGLIAPVAVRTVRQRMPQRSALRGTPMLSPAGGAAASPRRGAR